MNQNHYAIQFWFISKTHAKYGMREQESQVLESVATEHWVSFKECVAGNEWSLSWQKTSGWMLNDALNFSIVCRVL